jgi:hypothetical protein
MEVVAARSGKVRARRRVFQAGSASLALGLVLAIATLALRGDAPATSVALGRGGVDTAGYVATAPGGYRGAGTWRLAIVRDGHTLEYTNETSPPCAALGTIQPGDEVRGEIRGEESLLHAGEAAHC